MAGKGKGRRYYSYVDQKGQKHKVRWIITGVLVFSVFYAAISSMFFSMRVMRNDTMAPNFVSGERFIFSSYNFYSLIYGKEQGKSPVPFRRGNVVLVDMFREKRPNPFFSMLDGVVRFFTIQKVSLIERKEDMFVKRIIGLPGDEITMTNFVIRVRTKGSAYSLTEFEVTEYDYTLEIPQIPSLWDSSLPFFGSMESMVLGDNECFVLSDDRGNTNDSRTWGPVPIVNISGKALFRYWPFNRFGRV